MRVGFFEKFNSLFIILLFYLTRLVQNNDICIFAITQIALNRYCTMQTCKQTRIAYMSLYVDEKHVTHTDKITDEKRPHLIYDYAVRAFSIFEKKEEEKRMRMNMSHS